MSEINISLDEVSAIASKISNLNVEMYESLSEMKNQMNSLDGSWISKSGELIRQKFNVFATRFETQKEVIDSYVNFLQLTVSSYDSLETTIQSNASNLQE